MKEIPLHPDGVAFVDSKKYESLSKFKWYRDKKGYAFAYPESGKYKGKCIRMHRVIMNAKTGQQVDHKNRNRADNRKSNLRLVTHTDNCWNRGKSENCSSIYKGVSKPKGSNTWRAYCKVNQKRILLGSYTSEIAAAYAYNKYVSEVSKYALLNKLNLPKSELEKLLVNSLVGRGFRYKTRNRYKTRIIDSMKKQAVDMMKGLE